MSRAGASTRHQISIYHHATFVINSAIKLAFDRRMTRQPTAGNHVVGSQNNRGGTNGSNIDSEKVGL